jgi:hypothetical protein
MRVDTRPRKRNSPRIAEKHAPGFLQWLRGRECFVGLSSPEECGGKLEAAHVDHAGGKGMGTKVADQHAIPLCTKHHAMQHRIGWRSFEDHYMFGAVGVASDYWRLWPGRIAWERKQDANG